MLRVSPAALCVLLAAAPSLAQEKPSAPPAMTARDAALFAQLKRAGDQARAAGRLADAASAYTQALEVRKDATVAARLGLVALRIGDNSLAADLLLLSIEEGGGETNAERTAILHGFDRAQKLVCRVHVDVSEHAARVLLDGEPIDDKGGSFWLFVEPGPHEMRATLEGFEDDAKSFTAEKGGREEITLELRRTVHPPASDDTTAPASPATPIAAAEGGSEARPCVPCRAAAPRRTPAPSSTPARPAPPWFVGFGPAMVAGAVAQYPAMGFVLSGGRRWDVGLSAELDVRAAWSPYNIDSNRIRGVSVAALPAGCLQGARWFGCVEGHLGWILHETDGADSFVTGVVSRFRAGIGAKGGFEIPLRGPLALRVAGDLVFLPDDTPVMIGNVPIWTGPRLLAGLSATGVVRF